MSEVRLIVAGGRTFRDTDLLYTTLNDLSLEAHRSGHTLRIVSGTARGADTMGEDWAAIANVPVDKYPANWRDYGRGAGHIRNRRMAENADMLVAFWDGRSRGTANMIKVATELGLRVKVIRYD
jgi:hypothetical protein